MFDKLMRASVVAASIAAFGIFSTPASHAATETDTFDVTATIIASCTIAAGDLAFGNYDPLAVTALDATSTIAVTCSNGAAYNILLDGGLSGNVAARTMDDDATGTQTLNYSLFREVGRTTNWGETIATPDTVAGTGTGANQNITVFGRIPAGQTTPPVGDYTDTVTATIDF